ncbi:RNA transcription, translation and transport factor protein [Bactrocera neohumeralis]|uniref:RNA transcription, translation and transport factor protein n=1 Tax=Bactrocera neohumeralis TaxID=98809 RepID=UPI002165AC24|nr:RNA transcription, translation and transport factor protein [Bactrocera neohumeralis]
MLKLKLEALEHPAPGSVDVNDRKVFASTILWLEDQKIRQYKIEDREDLRKVDELEIWEQAYENYKYDLSMPQFVTPLEEITWLLGYAIRLEFLDAPESYKDINSIEVSKQQNKSIAPSIKAENFFDNMDFNHKDFIAGVRALATKLKIPQHPNHLTLLEAIARVVHERLSPSAKNRQAISGTPFPFEKGNDVVSDDSALDYPVRILRLLQIQSLRELQTKINETIVAVQDLTANPKTDTKLGKVGR